VEDAEERVWVLSVGGNLLGRKIECRNDILAIVAAERSDRLRSKLVDRRRLERALIDGPIPGAALDTAGR
jgi:hypothetical protein